MHGDETRSLLLKINKREMYDLNIYFIKSISASCASFSTKPILIMIQNLKSPCMYLVETLGAVRNKMRPQCRKTHYKNLPPTRCLMEKDRTLDKVFLMSLKCSETTDRSKRHGDNS